MKEHCESTLSWAHSVTVDNYLTMVSLLDDGLNVLVLVAWFSLDGLYSIQTSCRMVVFFGGT